jgi:putative addiction module component (TIGR02574 family)
MKTDIEDILRLPVDERLEIMEKIWESIKMANDDQIPDWHYEILEERLEKYRSDLNSGKSWKEVKESLLNRC